MRSSYGWPIALCALLFGLAILRVVVPRVPAFARRIRRGLRPARPRWRLSLLVWIDDGAGRIRPSVQIDGDPIPRHARIGYRLTSDRRGASPTGNVRLPASALGTEFPLPSFVVAEDEHAEDLIRGRWEITVTAHGRTIRRWTVWPAPAGDMNAEAEIV